jgi:DNA-binding IclR family transcriptional regulator
VERDHERGRRIVRDEYLEMPGLCLTVPQMQRLWGFDPPTCESVLSDLVSIGFLRRTAEGEYVLSGTARDLATSSRARDISSTPRDIS